MYINEPVKKYIEDLAARLPAPGGGSAAGLAGALGTALLEMVCNFTVGNEKYKYTEQEMLADLVSLGKIRSGFTALIDKDAEVYTAIRSAFKTKDEKVIEKALKDGYHISLKACGLSKSAMEIAMNLPEKGNPGLVTDIGCGAELLNAAFNSAAFNAGINLKSIKDKVFTAKESAALKSLGREIKKAYKAAIAKTKKKME